MVTLTGLPVTNLIALIKILNNDNLNRSSLNFVAKSGHMMFLKKES